MLQQLVILLLATAFVFIACAQKTEKKPIKTVSEPVDTTDVFAIPLDNSEREEDEDQKYLKKMEQERLKLEKKAGEQKSKT